MSSKGRNTSELVVRNSSDAWTVEVVLAHSWNVAGDMLMAVRMADTVVTPSY